MVNVEVFKIMQIKQKTYSRLKNHSIYYSHTMGNTYDDIIIKVLDYYEKNYNEDYDNDETEDDFIAELNK
jgi:hypothetical protein